MSREYSDSRAKGVQRLTSQGYSDSRRKNRPPGNIEMSPRQRQSARRRMLYFLQRQQDAMCGGEEADMETRLIICGGRDFQDYDLFRSRLDRLTAHYENIRIVSGHARDVDTFAEQYAAEKGIPISVFPAEWRSTEKQQGRSATGPCWTLQRKKRL